MVILHKYTFLVLKSKANLPYWADTPTFCSTIIYSLYKKITFFVTIFSILLFFIKFDFFIKKVIFTNLKFLFLNCKNN